MATIIEMPKLSDTMEEGGIASWHKNVGDFVKEGELLVEIETDKATMDYESPEEGYLLKIIVDAGKKSALNAPIAIIGEKGEDPEAVTSIPKDKKAGVANSKKPSQIPTDIAATTTKTESQTSIQNNRIETSRVKASPLAKKMASSKGLDLSKVQGSGPNGRVVAADLSNLAKTSAGTQLSAFIQTKVQSGEDSIVAVNMMRTTIAKRLVAAKNNAPHFYLTRSVNMRALLSWRERLNNAKSTSSDAIKISVNDILVLAASKALKQHPRVNASWEEEQIREFGHVSVAIAVAVENGLVTPVIKNSDCIGLKEISAVSKNLIAQVKSGGQVDYTSGTFTISNLGMFGIEEFTAIINPPQAAILAVGSTIETPVVKNGQIVIEPIMKITMSCDHRVVDGALGAQFLATLVSFIEDPSMMLV